MSFRLKTLLGVGLIEAVLLSILIWSSLHFLHDTSENEIDTRAQTTATLFATTTKDAVLSTDLASLHAYVLELLHNPGIVYARVLDQNKVVLAAAGNPALLRRAFRADQSLDTVTDGVFDIAANIDEGGTHYGRVEIGLSVANLRSVLQAARTQTSIIALSEIALTALFSTLLGLYLTRQLKDLREGAERLTHYDFGYQIPVKGKDELAQTARAFNLMSRRLADLHRERDAAEDKIKQLNEKLQRRVVRRDAQLRTVSERLQDSSSRDPLTGLPNRTQFEYLLNAYLSEAYGNDQGNEPYFALIQSDVLDFKGLNRALGRQSGNAVLMEITRRLRACLRDDDVVARIEADKFAILLKTINRNALNTVITKLKTALSPKYTIDDNAIELRIYMGAVFGDRDKDDARNLLYRVETALQQARNSSHRYHIYEPAIRRGVESPLFLPRDLPLALYDDQLQLYYQPKFSLQERRIVGVEALIRWQHPKLGFLSPDQFIPAAEHSSLIRELTLWVLEHALSQLALWQEKGADLHMAVNLSANFLQHDTLVNDIENLITYWQVPADRLTLEITESAMMADPVLAEDMLRRLAALGTRISIDDFGTGYSSLAYLKQLPVSELKIDKSFVLDMERDADNLTIVRSLIDMAHNLGLRVVAEGVESMSTLRVLEEMHCDHAQGYFIGKPQAATVAERSFIFPAKSG